MPFQSVVLVALTALCLQAAPALDTSTARQAGASIKGHVVDAATKVPLAGARVRLTGSSQREPIVTGDSGAFAFDGLPAGTYAFGIERTDYLPASWPAPSRWIRRRENPITIAAADIVENVTLALDRGGVVTGRVTTAAGDPLSGARVSLVGPGPAAFTRSETTGANGEYRAAKLAPGHYVLRVQPRPSTIASQDPPVSGALPTYYPGTLQRSEARELVVGPGGDVTTADLRLVDGVLPLLEVTVTDADGRPVTGGTVQALGSPVPLTRGVGWIAQNGVARLDLPSGDHTLYAEARGTSKTGPDSGTYDSVGLARVHLSADARQTATVVVGRNATASGRIVFEGDSAPPPPPAGARIPMLAPNGQICRHGSWTVAPDWTFSIDGLAGTCRAAPPPPLTARWAVTSVMLDGREVLDDTIWFEPGRHYEDVRIVMSDRRSQVRVRVKDTNGAPTGEYAAVLFPVQPDRWRNPERYVNAAAPLPASFIGMADPSGTGGEPGRSLRFIGRQSGAYYVIAVDDIEYAATRDAAVLEKLARYATRVTIPASGLIEVALQRHVLSDVLK